MGDFIWNLKHAIAARYSSDCMPRNVILIENFVGYTDTITEHIIYGQINNFGVPGQTFCFGDLLTPRYPYCAICCVYAPSYFSSFHHAQYTINLQDLPVAYSLSVIPFL